MKTVVAIVVVVAIAALLWRATKARAQAPAASKPDMAAKTSSDPKDVYIGLRNLMLQGSRSKFGLGATSKPTEPWGVVMDWGMEKGTATVIAMSDGSASVYLSSGGGFIGGKDQEPIRQAAQRSVDTARSVQLPPESTTDYPLPEQHGVFFYFLTDAGVFTLRTSEKDVQSPGHPLRQLGNAMQAVITEYRLWDSRKKSQAK